MLPGCVPYPDDFRRKYRAAGYWRGETLAELVRPWAISDPLRIALVTDSGGWSYRELDEWADRLASGLYELGIRARDRVVVQLPNIPEFVALSIALFRLGAVPVYALPAHRRHEVRYLCQHAEAVALVIADTYRGFDYRLMAAEVRTAATTVRHVLVVGDPGGMTALTDIAAAPRSFPPPDPAEVALFLLSGGTTGLPKLIPRTHDDYSYQLRACSAALEAGPESVYLVAQPAAHNAMLGCPGLLGTLLAGGRTVLAASGSPDDVFPLIKREHVTLLTLQPTMLMLWMEAAEVFGADLSGVLLQIGSAHLDPALARQVRSRIGSRLTHWFGMSEGILTYTSLHDTDEVAATSQGQPLSPADELRVVDEDDCVVKPGEIGELLVRGPTTIRGYYRADDYNASAFTPDGFLRTGDLVRITPAGNMVVAGRVKDVINRGGDKVPAQEVEDYLTTHPGVDAVAIVSYPDDFLGERACAFVVPAGQSPVLADLRAFLTEHGLADFKLPDRLQLVDSLPRTSFGKVNKTALRERLAAARSDR